MRKITTIFSICVLGLLANVAPAADKGMMHCFAFTVIPTATPAEWDAFYKATEVMPKKVKEVKQVWFGKLRRPLNQDRFEAAEAKKFTAETPKATVEATRVARTQGVCMLLASEDALKTYEANPYHKEWLAAYEKVRVAGTTTYDILVQ